MKKMFGYLTVAFLLAAPVVASAAQVQCIDTVPSMVNESVPVCHNIPGLGDRLILPAADFTATVLWEDLDARVNGRCAPSQLPGDCDYNDARVTVFGDYSSSVITLRFDGGLAAYLNTVGIIGANISVNRNSAGPVSTSMSWDPGAELILWDATSVRTTWYSGQPSRNADHKPHAIVNMTVSPAPEVPEPASVLIFGGGLVALGLWRRKAKT